MKHAIVAFAAFIAATAIAGVAYLPGDGPNVRSPLEVVGAFVYHVDHGNFGRACGLYADMTPKLVEDCSAGFVQNAAFGLMFAGVDMYDNTHIVPLTGKQVDDDTYTVKIASDAITPVTVTVERQESGRWRIAGIG